MALIGRFEDDSWNGMYDSGNRYESSIESIDDLVQDLLKSLTTKKIDSKWYIKINKSLGVSEVKIKDITEKTVLLEFLSDCVPRSSSRYALSDIEFIEEIKCLEF